MQESATAPWNLRISSADLSKLSAGFEPQDQDDKWRVSSSPSATDDRSNSGSGTTIAIHFARSGTGKELYVLFVNPSGGSSGSGGGGGGAEVEAITWEQNKGGIRISEEQAKKEAVILSRRVLECGFEGLPEYDAVDLWNHAAAQVGAD